MTAKQKKAIRERLSYNSENVRISKDGIVTVRDSYFYRHGRSEETLAGEILKAFPGAQILSKEDRFAHWPKTSYFVVSFIPSGGNHV